MSFLEIIYHCCECKKEFRKLELCDHSHDIILRNAGKFAFDDMVMCKLCCIKFRNVPQ